MSHWEAQIGATDEWYTPRYIFDALGCDFDLDVAHPPSGTSCPHAEHLFAGGSLESDWFGFVWANFPFGGRNGLAPWLTKFFDHGNGIGLTPDHTSAPWFRQAWQRADLVLFMPKVRFLRPDGTQGKSPSTGTTLWAAGRRAEAVLGRAADRGLGILAKPTIPQRIAA